jgi:oxygen-independent coproporphyrinogen-3 oxidase
VSITAPPLALYVHFPWCVRKCPYCDFNSYGVGAELPAVDYLDALRLDLEQQAPHVAGREIVSVFLGGGTPSLFSPEQIGAVLADARRFLSFADDAEITLEANPGTVERGHFSGYRAAGVNRVSVGAQTFDEQALRRLGRIHGADDTRRAAEELHAAGLVNFNLDLMYALPGQSVEAAVHDVDTALRLVPTHLSHYQLTLEPGTLFGAQPPADLPHEDTTAEMLVRCQERVAAAGFEQYEVSAYARAGRRCRHNLNYWAFGDYLGVGAGAHGKRTDAMTGAVVRTQRAREPRRYMKEARTGGYVERRVPVVDLPFEFMMNALRLGEGFCLEEFESRTGLDWSVVRATLATAVDEGLVLREGDRWRASPLGLRFLNELLLRFLP